MKKQLFVCQLCLIIILLLPLELMAKNKIVLSYKGIMTVNVIEPRENFPPGELETINPSDLFERKFLLSSLFIMDMDLNLKESYIDGLRSCTANARIYFPGFPSYSEFPSAVHFLTDPDADKDNKNSRMKVAGFTLYLLREIINNALFTKASWQEFNDHTEPFLNAHRETIAKDLMHTDTDEYDVLAGRIGISERWIEVENKNKYRIYISDSDSFNTGPYRLCSEPNNFCLDFEFAFEKEALESIPVIP